MARRFFTDPPRKPDRDGNILYGPSIGDVDAQIERAKTLPYGDIFVPLMEALSDGKMTSAEARDERERLLTERLGL